MSLPDVLPFPVPPTRAEEDSEPIKDATKRVTFLRTKDLFFGGWGMWFQSSTYGLRPPSGWVFQKESPSSPSILNE